MRRFIVRSSLFALAVAVACAPPAREVAISRSLSQRVSLGRAGIAVVATGGVTGWEHVTVLDSATARYVTVTRPACSGRCSPIDSASGTLTTGDVERIYAVADSERAYFERHRSPACAACDERAVVTTAVFGNRRRMVVRSAPETSPEVLGRVHVALAEAIRASRAPADVNAGSGPPND